MGIDTSFPDLELNKVDEIPLFQQVYQRLRDLILHGELAAGTQLPSSRWLAQREQVARVTVMAAYEQLAAEGYAISRRGAGTFVADDILALQSKRSSESLTPGLTDWGRRVMAHEASAPRGRERLEIEFGFGRSFAHIFPYDVWRRLLARYLSTDDIMLSRYGSAAGFDPLRQAIADYLGRQRGVHCTAEQVVIISGAQQALDILARLLIAPGDEVLVESPGYRDAFTLFEVNGARLVPLTVDGDGIPVEQIPQMCCARLAFVTPSHQFPRGGTLSLARRLALLQWAQQQNAFVIEDDYDSELRYDGRPLAALQGLDENGRVIYLGTFSKVLFPALRLGYIVLPPALLGPFVSAKGLVDRGAPTLTQAAVADFIAEGHFESHLRHLRKAYGERRQALVEALETEIPGRLSYSPIAAGLHVMLYLDRSLQEEAVVEAAAAMGVGVYAGAPFHLEDEAPPSILLGFSGLNTDEIREGVRRLATVL